jgi:hypothetical protein
MLCSFPRSVLTFIIGSSYLRFRSSLLETLAYHPDTSVLSAIFRRAEEDEAEVRAHLTHNSNAVTGGEGGDAAAARAAASAPAASRGTLDAPFVSRTALFLVAQWQSNVARATAGETAARAVLRVMDLTASEREKAPGSPASPSSASTTDTTWTARATTSSTANAAVEGGFIAWGQLFRVELGVEQCVAEGKCTFIATGNQGFPIQRAFVSLWAVRPGREHDDLRHMRGVMSWRQLPRARSRRSVTASPRATAIAARARWLLHALRSRKTVSLQIKLMLHVHVVELHAERFSSEDLFFLFFWRQQSFLTRQASERMNSDFRVQFCIPSASKLLGWKNK